MSNKIKGTVLVSGQIAPSDERDLYPTHEDIFGKGGYSVVDEINDRDAISDERRKEGMAVYVKNIGEKEIIAKVYVLQDGITNNDWVEWPFGGGGPGTPENLQVTLDTGAQFNGSSGAGGKLKINYGASDINVDSDVDGFRIEEDTAGANAQNRVPITLLHGSNTSIAPGGKTASATKEISITSQDNTNYNQGDPDKGVSYTSLKVNESNIVVEANNNSDLDSPVVDQVLAVKTVENGAAGTNNRALLHWADMPVVEPEIVTVKHTLGYDSVAGINTLEALHPVGGSSVPYVLLPTLKGTGNFYNILNIHCKFTPKVDEYILRPTGEANLVSMHYRASNQDTGSIIPVNLLEALATGGDKYFIYGNPFADPYRDGKEANSWNPADEFVISSGYEIDLGKTPAEGELDIWVTYTLTSLT